MDLTLKQLRLADEKLEKWERNGSIIEQIFFYCHVCNGIAVGFLHKSLKVYDFK